MSTKLNFQKRMMYKLKRDMGIPVSYYQPIQNDQDVETGEITRDYTVIQIRRAIVFETRQLRSFIYDLSFIAANKNFTMGGYFDVTDRLVAFHKIDVPSTFVPSNNDHMVIKHRKYMVKEIAELEDNEILAFKVKEIKGLIVREFHTISLENVMELTHEQS